MCFYKALFTSKDSLNMTSEYLTVVLASPWLALKKGSI